MIPFQELKEGEVLEKSTEALSLYYPDVHEEVSLQSSLIRFIDLASSSNKQGKFSLRAMRPAYILHGEPHHETWVVDFSATMAFRQYLHSLLVITEGTDTAYTAVTGRATAAPPSTHDADARTNIFDFELANYIDRVERVEVTFQDYRRYPDWPNIHPPVSSGEDVEIDLPLRLGSVFVPVQTKTSVIEQSYEEGEYDSFHRRWESVKKKRQDTDRNYARKLVENSISREFLLSNGITHVLPIVCTPFPEPVVSDRESYWLRWPSEETLSESIQLPEATVNEAMENQSWAVPRVLTPTELYEFLETTVESELKEKAWRVTSEQD